MYLLMVWKWFLYDNGIYLLINFDFFCFVWLSFKYFILGIFGIVIIVDVIIIFNVFMILYKENWILV